MRAIKASTFACVVVVATLAACSQKEPKSVAYYTANPAERDQLWAECKNNPGKYKDDPDCINAGDSKVQNWGKTDLPPVQYGPAPSAAASR